MTQVKLNNQGKEEINMAESFEYSDTARKKFKVFWRRFKKHKLAVAGIVVLGILYFCAIFAPLLAPYDPNETNLFLVQGKPIYHSYKGMNEVGAEVTFKPNLMGRDDLGRDVFSRALYAGRVSLSVGFISVGISVIIGVIWGSIAGFYGGWIDNVMMRIVDAIMCIPTMMLLITILAVFPPNLLNVMIVLGFTSWTGIARYVRAEFLSLKKRDFVEAARGIGCRDRRLIFSHILPNATAPLIVSATMMIAGMILTESSLSYFGLGVQPPTATWGNMLTSSQEINTMIGAPWNAFYPGLLIFLTVLSFNFVGDGLRDALDPKLKQ